MRSRLAGAAALACAVVLAAQPVQAQPRTPVSVAASQVGRSPSYAAGGYWCAGFVSWVYDQTGQPWVAGPDPNAIHLHAQEAGRLSSTPHVGGLVFIRFWNLGGPDQWSHVGIVESVANHGTRVVMISGNYDDPKDRVLRTTLRVSVWRHRLRRSTDAVSFTARL